MTAPSTAGPDSTAPRSFTPEEFEAWLEGEPHSEDARQWIERCSAKHPDADFDELTTRYYFAEVRHGGPSDVKTEDEPDASYATTVRDEGSGRSRSTVNERPWDKTFGHTQKIPHDETTPIVVDLDDAAAQQGLSIGRIRQLCARNGGPVPKSMQADWETLARFIFQLQGSGILQNRKAQQQTLADWTGGSLKMMGRLQQLGEQLSAPAARQMTADDLAKLELGRSRRHGGRDRWEI